MSDSRVGLPEAINPESLGFPKGYSHGMLGPRGGRSLFVAGQIGVDPKSGEPAGFIEQFQQALANVVTVVEAAGGTNEHVASLTIYVLDKNQYLNALREVGTAYRAVMGRHFPATALLEVAGLVDHGAQVEIQAIAVLP